MSNQYTMYSSTDASAPTLTASAGSLITVLTAILVNGYGAKPAAGWSIAFTSTNAAVFRAPSGVQHYWQVNDNVGATAPVLPFETMSAYNTGTGQFPTNAQNTGPVCIPKTTSGWVCFADSRTFIFLVFGLGGGSNAWGGGYYGELFATQANDSYRSLIRSYTGPVSALDNLSTLSTSIASATAASFMPRGYSGVGTSIAVSATGDNAKSGGAVTLKGIIPLPNPEEGGLYLSPVWISDPTTSPANNIRGRMRGFWHCLHPNTSITNLATYTGLGDLAGRTFISLTPTADPSEAGCYMIETSATLETN